MKETDGHSTPEELAAYHAGSLAPDEEERLQDHLALCRECTAKLLELGEFLAEAGEDTAGPLPEELEGVWRDLRAQLPVAAGPEPPLPAPLPFSSARADHRPAARPRWLPAAASVLLATTLGLAGWGLHLRRTVQELSEPQANVPFEDLFPEAVRSGQGEPAVVEIAPGTRLFTLVLNPDESVRADAYVVEIARADGGTVWRGSGLRANPYGSLSLVVPLRAMGAGEYRILLREEGGSGRPAGEFRLRIVLSPPE